MTAKEKMTRQGEEEDRAIKEEEECEEDIMIFWGIEDEEEKDHGISALRKRRQHYLQRVLPPAINHHMIQCENPQHRRRCFRISIGRLP